MERSGGFFLLLNPGFFTFQQAADIRMVANPDQHSQSRKGVDNRIRLAEGKAIDRCRSNRDKRSQR